MSYADGKLVVVVPLRRDWDWVFRTLMLSGFLWMWGILLFHARLATQADRTPPPSDPLTPLLAETVAAVWVWVWAVFAVLGVYLWLALLVDSKRIAVDGKRLTMQNNPLLLRRSFRLDLVRNLRVRPAAPGMDEEPGTVMPHLIAFDYRGREQRFGTLRKEDGEAIVAAIEEHFGAELGRG
jgi:hypothetical protein